MDPKAVALISICAACYVSAFITYRLWHSPSLFPLWLACVAFSPIVVNATWTLLPRVSHGERIWRARGSRRYQRLVLAGWSHRRTVLRSHLLMVACAITAVAARGLGVQDQWFLLVAWAVIYLLLDFGARLAVRLAGAAPP